MRNVFYFVVPVQRQRLTQKDAVWTAYAAYACSYNFTRRHPHATIEVLERCLQNGVDIIKYY